MELINFKKLNKLKPKKGRVLISEPFLDDDYFKRSVVLLCEHNEEGSFGFVLNNYMEFPLAEIMDDFPEFKTRISIGGPVNNDNLYYVHTLGEKITGSLEILPGIYMGGSFDEMKSLIESKEIKESEIRFFVGYSGWSLGQLENELKESAWIVSMADKETLMDTSIKNLWKKILGEMGENHQLFSNYPEDPNLN
jgi:putative transcriptional regulator